MQRKYLPNMKSITVRFRMTNTMLNLDVNFTPLATTRVRAMTTPTAKKSGYVAINPPGILQQCKK